MEQLKALLDSVATDPWLRAGIILTAAFLLAFIADWTCTRLLKTIARRTKTDLDDQLVELFHRPVQVTVVLLGASAAFLQLDLNSFDQQGKVITDWEGGIHNTIQTIITVVWMLWGFRFSRLLLRVLSKDTKRFQVIEPTTLPLFDNLARVLIFGFSVYLMVSAWGGDVSTVLASAGVMGIALGFAAKDSLSNLFAGVFILADAPYRLGDFIVLDSGERGEVVHIGIRSTRLLTRDDIEITIPNAVMGAAKILNETGGASPKRRVRIPVGVAYGSDVDQVRAVLMDVAQSMSMVCKDPLPRVRFRRFGDSTLDFELLCWIPEPVLRGRATDELLTNIYKRFDKDGIQIAFPQLDVHLHRG
ncbi:MAG: mechanosensitive ion channel family protein [Planctomycetes bacterium]|nr:mechanosensitive ion channel family protein [Planctomycetota bacterium]